MLPRWLSICTLLCLLVCFDQVAAGRLGPYPRQETSPSTVETTKTTQNDDREPTTTPPDNSETPSSSSAKPTPVEVTTTATSTPESTTIPSALNGNNPSNDNFSEEPAVVKGEVPIQPRLTPGWGVSGAIMLITGVVYALVGIKNTRLHTFFSSAYLASLCVAVLIVYVMNPPISDAIQGAYVVAAVCAGLLLGGAATVFKELTEGLGCLLGGFCFSMWLLTLREGGLLPATTGKVIFIAAFTVAGFAFYFSHYTRPYAMIGLMSFAGATVTVLGIDCFTRAGLKEFWAYIWNLNDNLFPLEATTYPLTKGIKVEIAMIIVLTILGLISQFKLWRVIQEHRARRFEERAEFERMRDEEEASVGRRVEEDNKRERRQWETTYGDLSTPPSPTVSRDSGVGEIENEKRGQVTQTTVQPVSPSEMENENAIEMTDLPSEDNTSSEVGKHLDEGLVIAGHNEDNRITVRVSRDYHDDKETATLPEPDENAWMAGVDNEMQPGSPRSLRNSRRISNLTGPEITPLPFKVPELDEKDIDDNDDDRSSFATFADEDDRSITLSKRASRASLSHRLSVGSGNLLRGLSQRSKRETGESELPQPSSRWGESNEGLVSKNQKPTGDTGSIVATVDGMSDNGENGIEFAKSEKPAYPREIKAELGNILPKEESSSKDRPVAQLKPTDSGTYLEVRPYSTAETVATDILNPSFLGEPLGDKSKRSSATNATGKIDETDGANLTNAMESKTPSDTSKVAKSASPSAVSSASLTKEHLPSSLSRVALSYRTNEWAKHLTLAEKPEPDTLRLNEYVEAEETSKRREEAPAPVNVDELQQTAESGIPAASIVRSYSSVSNAQSNVQAYRSSSRTTITGAENSVQAMSTAMPLVGQSQDTSDKSNNTKGAQPNIHTNHSLRMKGRRQSSDIIIQPILEEKGDEHGIKVNSIQEEGDGSASRSSPSPSSEFESQGMNRPSVPGVVSYSSPQTLIGKRDMFLRSKSQSTVLFSPPNHEATQYTPRSISQMEQPYNLPASSSFAMQDADDLPLSKRKELIRQSSLLSAQSATINPRPHSTMRMPYTPGHSPGPTSPVAADSAQFNSHQPQRHSTAPSQAHREALLANFRQSVAVDLRANTPVSPAVNNSGETLLVRSGSSTLLGPMGIRNGNNDVQYNIDQQRSMLLSQREQEAQRREQERREKERNERAFEEMMRRGDLIDAHREAMRRMQSTIKDQ
ncbi:hypothetical protein F4813DRAFT_57226 [Daldinia decipiens]|uniref:uncharacterized protein n=1 Tax=Daldinia decipiens TaxID=326647 RepID=UPI0020C37D69|nr:uncharacterized protein F4813DRAFT_57226 [Daldinia decipiens]KAI1658199.1 hypothetical protein F4813DRAFT_57226 [Daldinia decipiens]